MNISYHIRTMRNKPVHSFETLERAKQGKIEAEKRVGIPMKIVKITYTEEELTDAEV